VLLSPVSFDQVRRYSRIDKDGPGARVFIGLCSLKREDFRSKEGDSGLSENIFTPAKKNGLSIWIV